MSELLSHPLDPLGARVLVPVGRPGVPAPFALRSASTIALGVRLVGGRATLDSLVYGMPRPARGTTPRVQIGSCVDGGASLIRYGLLK